MDKLVHLSSCSPSSAKCQVRWCWTGLPPTLAFWSGSTSDCSIWVTRHTWWGTALLQLWHHTTPPRISASKGINVSMIHYCVCIWNGEKSVPSLVTLYAVLGQWSTKFWRQKSFLSCQIQTIIINNLDWYQQLSISCSMKFCGRKFCNFVQNQRYCGLYFATSFKINLFSRLGENICKVKIPWIWSNCEKITSFKPCEMSPLYNRQVDVNAICLTIMSLLPIKWLYMPYNSIYTYPV